MNLFLEKQNHLFVVFLVLITCVPFLHKAYHIDDTFVLAITENIIHTPLDPLRGEIDWTGNVAPIIETTTNPVFISYFLAPFAAISDYNEIVLHSAMMVFIFLYAFSLLFFCQRFAHGSWYPLLFALVNPAVMISGNVMRDTPALGLATAGLALFIYGTDENRKPHLFLGSLLAGLAVMAKYSAIITLPVMILYPLLKRKYSTVIWIWPLLACILAWCIHNKIYYGMTHMAFLAAQKHQMAPKSWQNKTCGALMLTGGTLFLFPLFLYSELLLKRWRSILLLTIVGAISGYWVYSYWQRQVDAFYLFLSVTGTILLFIALIEGFKKSIPLLRNWQNEDASDSLFLMAWLCAPILFSILFVPFQAIRHLLVALPPLAILLFLSLPPQETWRKSVKVFCFILFLVQAGISFAVHYADCEYADVYRQQVTELKEHWGRPSSQPWYLGHWGWKFYADRAGFRQFHYNREWPKKGDILFWPEYLHVGEPFMENKALVNSMELLSTKTIDGTIPIRTMNRLGAKFYATIWRDTPFRFQTIPLEKMRIYRFKTDYAPAAGASK